MSFTFDPELGDDISKVRTLLGDTTKPGEAQDEAIQWALEVEGHVIEAAAFVADTLSSKFAGKASSRTIGELSLTFTQRSSEYSALADRLRNMRRTGAVVPIGFGWSRSQKLTEELDTDREPIVSKKGGMDRPGISEEI